MLLLLDHNKICISALKNLYSSSPFDLKYYTENPTSKKKNILQTPPCPTCQPPLSLFVPPLSFPLPHRALPLPPLSPSNRRDSSLTHCLHCSLAGRGCRHSNSADLVVATVLKHLLSSLSSAKSPPPIVVGSSVVALTWPRRLFHRLPQRRADWELLYGTTVLARSP